MRKTFKLFCDIVVLFAAATVFYNAYCAGITNARRQERVREIREREIQFRPPVVDWSNVGVGLRGNTGELMFEPEPLPKPESKSLPGVQRRPLVPVKPLPKKPVQEEFTGPFMWA